MRTEYKLITPDMANKILSEKNKANRSYSPIRGKMFADLIRDGKFLQHHQGIAFFKDGTLADGQHRLHGIVISGIPVMLMVTYGLDKSAYIAVDRGMAKSISEVLFPGAKGANNAVVTVATTALRLAYEGTRRVTAEAVKGLLDTKHESILGVCEFCNTAAKGVSAAPVKLAACIWEEETKTAKETFRNLVLNNIEDMTKFERNIWKRLITMSSTGMTGLFAYKVFGVAFSCFDPQKQNISKVPLKPNKYYREIIRNWIDGGDIYSGISKGQKAIQEEEEAA